MRLQIKYNNKINRAVQSFSLQTIAWEPSFAWKRIFFFKRQPSPLT